MAPDDVQDHGPTTVWQTSSSPHRRDHDFCLRSSPEKSSVATTIGHPDYASDGVICTFRQAFRVVSLSFLALGTAGQGLRSALVASQSPAAAEIGIFPSG